MLIKTGIIARHANIFAIEDYLFVENNEVFKAAKNAFFSNTIQANKVYYEELINDSGVTVLDMEEIEPAICLLKDKYFLHNISKSADILQAAARSGRIDITQDALQRLISEAFSTSNKEVISSDEAIEEAKKVIMGEENMFIKSHLDKIDDYYGGISIGKLTTIVGWNRNGKTSSLISIFNRNLENENVCFFINTTEVSESDFQLELACTQLGIELRNVRKGHISDIQKANLISQLEYNKAKQKGRVRHYSGTDIVNCLANAKVWSMEMRAKNANCCPVVVLDFINKFTLNGKSMYDTIPMRMTQTLVSNFSEHEKITVIQYAQMSDGYLKTKSDEPRMPTPTDIYLGGGIMADSYTVLFIAIPERIAPLETGAYVGCRYLPAFIEVWKNKAGGELKSLHHVFDTQTKEFKVLGDYSSYAEAAARANGGITSISLQQAETATNALHAHFNKIELPF